MNPRRAQRIGEEIRRETSNIIQNKIKDPRLPDLVSVSKVEVTRDLGYATIMVTVLGDEEAKAQALEGLENAKGFIKKELGRAIKLRSMPELIFELDDRVEKNMAFEQMVQDLHKDDPYD